MNKKKIVVGAVAALAIVGGVVAMSAFEAHVINVTARIENALSVSAKELDFGTVFPQEELEQSFTVSLSESFIEQAQCTDILINGGFEQPEIENAEGWQTFTGDEVDGWEVEWANPDEDYTPVLVEYQGSTIGWTPYEDDQWTELASDWSDAPESQTQNDARVIIYQEVATTPGVTYQLHYAYSGRPGRTSTDNQMEVRVNERSETYQEGDPGDDTDWKEDTIIFVADSSLTTIEFEGTGDNYTHGMFLDGVELLECGRLTMVNYVLRQKPKCWNEDDANPKFGLVTEEGDEFVCQDEDFEILPLLCPYLSKRLEEEEITAAFHGLPLEDGIYDMNDVEENQITGTLYYSENTEDEWLIDLKVPCFRGYCAQDWEEWVASFNDIENPDDYMLDPEDEGNLFGCDLWLEVTGFGEEEGEEEPEETRESL